MTTRPNPYMAAGNLIQPLIEFGNTVAAMGLEPGLVELIKIRASQINGCAACLHMHVRDARKAGESEMRIFLLDAWRESPLFSARERAAMGWTEALTRLGDEHGRDLAYEAVAQEFTPEEQVKLTLMITAINSFNRLNVGFKVSHPGSAPRVAA
ncbi:carboxymuconolactone decarboxylase family protein [Devosia sp.]|uniref:carboxymuconolactone decarboxylase family protein n=1 Tax=Devosia sp. TaxID=1871048 RepID=UPI002FC81844